MENYALKMGSRVVNLPIDKIYRNPNQPRRLFDKQSLDDLAASIKEFGVMQPINVRLNDQGEYELVAGERRVRASALCGRETIPALVINISAEESAILAIVENLQRQNLNFFEEANGYQRLISEFNFKQEDLAVKIGKNQSTIANKLRLLKLSDEIQAMICESELTERHARALLKLTTDAERIFALKKIIKENLNVQKSEELIEKILKQKEEGKKHEQKIKRYIKDIRLFTNTIKGAVRIMNDSGIESEYKIEETEYGLLVTIKVNSNDNF